MPLPRQGLPRLEQTEFTSDRLLRYGRQSVVILILGWCLTITAEVVHQLGLINRSAVLGLMLGTWSCASGLLVWMTWRSMKWPVIRYVVLVFSVFLVALYAIKFARSINSFENLSLFDTVEIRFSLITRTLSAGWTCSIAFYVYLLLSLVGQSHEELESHVTERTVALQEANQKLEAEIAHRKEIEDDAHAFRSHLSHQHRLSTIGEMASSLAHEINQPLGVITNLVNASVREAQQGRLEPHGVLPTLEIIREQAIAASEILRRIRPLVSNDVAPSAVHAINDIVVEVLRLMEPEYSQYETRSKTDFQDPLPSIWVSRVEIQQVIVNLVSNALDAQKCVAPEQREIVIRTAMQGACVSVAVEDSGPEVPEHVMERLFDPYFTTKPTGLGLGLAISRSIIEKHGGQVEAVAKPVGGLIVRFTLPLTPPINDQP